MEENLYNRKLTRLFSTILPITFVLNGYGIGSIGIGLGSFVLVFFMLLSIVDTNKMVKTKNELRPFLVFMVLMTISLVDFFVESTIDINGVFVNAFKMAVWAMSITFLATSYFNLSIFIPHFRRLCRISTAYLFLQNISWMLFGFFLPNLFTIGPIRPLYEQYSQDSLKEYIIRTDLTRFGSFFSEPAFYGHLMIVDIILLLFLNKRKKLDKKEVAEIVFVSFGILISTSTAAIVFLILILGWYLISSHRIKHLVILFGVTMIGYVVLRFSPLKNQITVAYFFRKITNIQELGRVGKSYENILKLNIRELLFGVGVGNTSVIVPGYLNSFTSIIISFGLVGFFSFLVFVIKYIVKEKCEVISVLLFIYLLASFQGAIAFSLSGILFFSLVMAILKEKRKFQVFREGEDLNE